MKSVSGCATIAANTLIAAARTWAAYIGDGTYHTLRIYNTIYAEAVLADFPQLGPHVVRVESSTALSTEHYTRTPRGAMYGHYHSVAQMGRYRLPQIIRIHNFVQVGQGVFTPGILGTTLSAYYGCGYYLGLERLVAELEAT